MEQKCRDWECRDMRRKPKSREPNGSDNGDWRWKDVKFKTANIELVLHGEFGVLAIDLGHFEVKKIKMCVLSVSIR